MSWLLDVVDVVVTAVAALILTVLVFGFPGKILMDMYKGRSRSVFHLGQMITKLVVFVAMFSYSAMHWLILLTKTIDKKMAWRSSHIACLNDEHRHNWNAAGSSICLEAANHKRLYTVVWLSDVWERGIVGLYLGHNGSELFHLFVHQNIGVQTVTVAVVAVLPAMCIIWWVKNVIQRKSGSDFVIPEGMTCWTTPEGETKCACIHSDESPKISTKPQASIGPSE